MEDSMNDKVEQLVDYIMKKCLWQFHSRSWDREKQNEGILTKTMQILCEEPVEKETPADRCYWVDAVCLADGFKSRYPWLAAMDQAEIKLLMQALKERIDYLTITGSLNAELTDPRY
ncbi:Fe-only nitrogenase subunit delta|uniref:Nitrogenase iron-iron protein delta chain n=1 Tax=Dendrosporobacter quercicolus TaxID=146817 RepID=A0A1G9SJH1_9FIRM|nr:Fe-only nitrogenase subunit delta [Dendrosporobacter quercicolus]NSL48695.1 Fe-only nitrogenase subunit delta [Dendrosporobacter quercicolus DSM 1736]SDM35646.1 Fe-only nitrogenase FeFe protein subunit AnfG [Dendrosporobacter quercicolus]